MSLKRETRERIKHYILEQISRNEKDFIKKTSEAFSVSDVSVYKYLNELISQEIVIKNRRNYSLALTVDKTFRYSIDSQIGEDRIFSEDIKSLLDGLPNNVFKIWEYAIEEMINNVIDHSETSQFYIKVCRDYINTSVIISDEGVGIFRKIADYYNFSSLDIAIEELFKGKLTTNVEMHSGEGIFFTSRIMDLFAALSSGKCFTHNKFSDFNVSLTDIAYDKGTVIYMRLSNISNKTLRSIFDEYADVDGGFTKTKLPLKNIFETYPVSRSQAKRLANRFEYFEEVILDFDEISDIGQGFAHELFVVYAKQHPKITLTPININETVKRMIYHVTH